MNGNKPDWKDAPEWAKYCAMDANGRWYWYEVEPYYSDREDAWLCRSGTQYQAASVFSLSWEESLEERPE